MGELLESKKLKPCPFCGNKNIFLARDDVDVFGRNVMRFIAQCNACGASVYDGTEKSTKAKWNRRWSDGL